jgi:ABC-type Zn uptake system ZnuABC Zn-binding protein ZnuA
MSRGLVAAFLAVALASACGGASPAVEGPDVVATVFPVAELTGRLAGRNVAVSTLLPPRASPASWEPSPGQIRTLRSARGVVSVGAGLDAWVEELLPGGTVLHLRLTRGMRLRDTGHPAGPDGDGPGGTRTAGPGETGVGDPHVWLDPLRVRDRILPALTGFLAGLFPAESDGVRARAAALSDSLTALDAEIRRLLADVPERRFVATHDAWGYFAEAYDLRPLGSVYERPGQEPSARGLARLVERARAAGVTTILTEPQLASTAAEALAAELGVEVRVVDPLGGPGVEGREDYFEMMRFNARAFREALGGS